MAIPDFQTIMRPLLVHLADERIHANKETLAALAGHFELSEDERAEMLPSGQQPVFVNRVAWAKAHLNGAGLIASPARARYRITPAGLAALVEEEERIDLRYLKRFEQYRHFRGPSEGSSPRRSKRKTATL